MADNSCKTDESNNKRKCFKEEPTDIYKKTKNFNESGDNKPSNHLKSSKIQLKLAPSSAAPKSIAAAKSINAEQEKITAPILVNKLPSGNLAPSKKQPTALVKTVSQNVSKAFGSDSEDEEKEEMPIEAKMKMRNLGRNTPTSQGPNSYGKTNLGFCDSRKLFEKQLREKAEELLKIEEDAKLAKQ